MPADQVLQQDASPILLGALWAKWWYQRSSLEQDLQDAVRHRELEVYYQPRVHLGSGMMRGVEALLRWRHPVLGLLAPGLFLPLAEQTGAILDMGHWLLEEVCRQASEWVEPGIDTPISVNVSATELSQANLPVFLAAMMTRLGIPAKTIELEVAEPGPSADQTAFVRQLERLQGAGARVVLDRFGCSPDGLSRLAEWPVDAVKIDRSVIRRVDRDERVCASLAQLIAIARERGLETVAEGVERETQVNRLKALGFVSAQGYYYAKPGPSYRLEYWMEGKI
jgi:EAL domain-containing protein (putative c-di-GMP-specific phosphodiesterase class I)